jgi:hypothetical protein
MKKMLQTFRIHIAADNPFKLLNRRAISDLG